MNKRVHPLECSVRLLKDVELAAQRADRETEMVQAARAAPERTTLISMIVFTGFSTRSVLILTRRNFWHYPPA